MGALEGKEKGGGGRGGGEVVGGGEEAGLREEVWFANMGTEATDGFGEPWRGWRSG